MIKANLPKVLIVTGGLLSAGEKSMWNALKKQYKQVKAAKAHWLETKIKLVTAEMLVYEKLKKKRGKLAEYFKGESQSIPELTEVVLADLLYREGIPFEAITYDLLYSNPKKANQLLQDTQVVLASSTLLHDLSELMPLIKMLKRDHNRIILGGALCGSLYSHWKGDSLVDIMAIGYGEFLVPKIADWIKSGFKEIRPPEQGRMIQKEHTLFLFSGVPESRDLDFLPTPDWRVAESYHQRKFEHVYYESVRGCPYRCSFCNYPFLFDDKKFRTKSAEKIAADWKFYYEELGVKYITCLDSLFTMPKKRLVELCKLLIAQKTNVKWICYARADDLADESVVKLMKAAGVSQVQIGLESGNQMMLDQMNKRCTVEQNLQAIKNCRKHGVISMVSLIVGYPGETEKTLKDTLNFMREARPDFHFLATFSVRIEDVPMFKAPHKERFGLEKMDNPYSFAPYWRHNTMSCSEVGEHVRILGMQLCEEKISLEGALFYQNILHYEPVMKEEFLEYQQSLIKGNTYLKKVFNWINHKVDLKLQKDMKKVFPDNKEQLQQIKA
ncbi:radical SAM protein [Marivirga sp. S37H4]|uniref:Radical SAM protein n=1 Tax=Marivirga aurantiaca TaxID=2802615 RepID=A0A934WZ78_9BACT|nr:radical SAM protein [Marivirga aurantiaca]MBK6265501.1 radical SAM protein [Marivirga aurantiaca]